MRTPHDNLRKLRANRYPGRGIVAGLDVTGKYFVQVYFVTGRKPSSRNRVLTDIGGGAVITELAGPALAKGEDTSLLLYDAMAEHQGECIVSNGDQTGTIIEALTSGRTFRDALNTRQYEPDAPNNTPRITAMVSPQRADNNNVSVLQMSVLRKAVTGTECERCFFDYPMDDLTRGWGYCITTYTGDADPSPAFRGHPYILEMYGGIGDVALNFWEVLDVDNRVAVAVKFINVRSGKSLIRTINKLRKVI